MPASNPAPLHSVICTSPCQSAELIIDYLQRLGVEYVFGVPGGAIEPLYSALARSERAGGPRIVGARHETGAAFMAEGYARETGRIGVCIATSGPGATNLITGVANAYVSEIPLLVITGQPMLAHHGRRALQDSSQTAVNILGMFQQCTRYNALISHPSQVQSHLINALVRAQQLPRGPVHLSVPVDVLRASISPLALRIEASLRRPTIATDANAVSMLASELVGARRVLFFVGDGAADAIDAVLELARRLQADIISTPDAKGLIDPDHVSYHGVFGFAGHASAEAALGSEPDLVLVFGATLCEFGNGGWSRALFNERMIHIDACAEHFLQTPMARLHVLGDIDSVCQQLLVLLAGDVDDSPRSRQAARVTLTESETCVSDSAPIKPQRLMAELARRCLPGTRFVIDSGNCLAWAIHYLHPRSAPNTRRSTNPNLLRMVIDYAPMGWGLGAAIGMARANSDTPLVCIVGDGSYLMSGQEITAAVAERLPILFVVLNDAAYGMVKHGQRLAGAECVGAELPPVDFRLLAQALGVTSYVAESPRDLADVDFAQCFARPGPTLLDVRIDGEEVPPMGLRMKTLGSIQEET